MQSSIPLQAFADECPYGIESIDPLDVLNLKLVWSALTGNVVVHLVQSSASLPKPVPSALIRALCTSYTSGGPLMASLTAPPARRPVAKASSTLNRSAEYGPANIFDGKEDTCWNSDAVGTSLCDSSCPCPPGRSRFHFLAIAAALSVPAYYGYARLGLLVAACGNHSLPQSLSQGDSQWLTLNFKRPVVIRQFTIVFQGGFVAQVRSRGLLCGLAVSWWWRVCVVRLTARM